MNPADDLDALINHVRAAVDLAPDLAVALRDIATILEPSIHDIRRVSVRLLAGEDVRVAGVWSSQPTMISGGTVLRALATSLPELTQERHVVIERVGGLDPALDEVLRREGIWSWVSVALTRGDAIRGALSISSGRLHAFADDDAGFFDELGAAVERRLLALAGETLKGGKRAKN